MACAWVKAVKINTANNNWKQQSGTINRAFIKFWQVSSENGMGNIFPAHERISV